MSEEAISAPTPESASPQASASVEGQGQTSGEQGATTQAASSQPAAQPAEKQTWDGKLESLKTPEDIERGKAMQRYLTKKSQELAEYRKQAEEFTRIKSSPEWQAYQQWASSQGQQPVQPSSFSAEELEQLGIDPRLVQAIESRVGKQLAEKEALFAQRLQEIQFQQARSAKQMELESFAEAHPNFYKYVDLGIAQPIVKAFVDEQGKTLEEAYEEMERINSALEQEALKKSQARVAEKKAAVSATPSVNNEPGYVEVDSEQESRDMAFKLAAANDPRKVRIRKKASR